MKKGLEVLCDKTLYRSIAFTRAERDRLGLSGLLPHRVSSRQQLVERVMTSLVVRGRNDLMEHNLPHAHEHEPLSFVEAIDVLRPNMQIGATGVAGTFTCEAIERMSADPLFLAAAGTLADLVGEDDLARGSLYPPLKEIRKVSLAIATRVAERAYASNLAHRRRPANVKRSIRELMYDP